MSHLEDPSSTTRSAGQVLELAIQHHRNGQLAKAGRLYDEVLQLEPSNINGLHLAGIAAYQRGRFDESRELLLKALTVRPDFPEALNNLGLTLKALGRFPEAVKKFQEAIRIRPHYTAAFNNLGNVLKERGQTEAAINCYNAALNINPDIPNVLGNLAVALHQQSRVDEAIDVYRRALELVPGNRILHSNFLYALGYTASASEKEITDAHIAFGRQFDRPAGEIPPHTNDPSPERRLRIAYVSGDFRQHAMAALIEPVLANHDPAAVEVFCYSEVRREDQVTARFKTLVPHWRRTLGLSDADMAAQIRTDGIDIAIDLSGHTAANRLTALALKPAPVQVGWFGYPGTRGLAAIDYVLGCPGYPAEGDDTLFVERIWRLPHTERCYLPPDDAPVVAPPPCERNGAITFGCYNNPTKASETVFRLWAEILHAVPGSRLVLKYAGLDEEARQQALREQFAAMGIAPKRLGLVGASPFRVFLGAFADIDLALDPFPFTSGSTTAHSLWMGVPVVTMEGRRLVSRLSSQILRAADLGELVADSPEAYRGIALGLARRPDRLTALRAGLRARMQASPLLDHATFVRDLEAAYRGMWQAWCPAWRPVA